MEQLKKQCDRIIERLKIDLSSLRTGRASTALIENILVDYYGSQTPLKAVAALSSPGPRELLIQPWDKTLLPAIEKAIQVSPLGLNPITDGMTIRLSIPPLTEERRHELAKQAGRHREQARIAVRRARDEELREFDRANPSENARFQKKQEVQKTIEEVNGRIDEMTEGKEKEIMTV